MLSKDNTHTNVPKSVTLHLFPHIVRDNCCDPKNEQKNHWGQKYRKKFCTHFYPPNKPTRKSTIETITETNSMKKAKINTPMTIRTMNIPGMISHQNMNNKIKINANSSISTNSASVDCFNFSDNLFEKVFFELHRKPVRRFCIDGIYQ